MSSACSGDYLGIARLWRAGRNSASQGKSGARAFVRVEDLPPAPPPAGYVRIDDLAPAAPVAVRPLRPEELTPQLIRRADDVLRNHEKSLGSQVLVDLGESRYIARFEWHYRYERAQDHTDRWHKGVTLYATE